MIWIGCHMSVAKGYAAMAEKMKDDYKGDTLAFFLRNPRGGRAKPLDDEDAARFAAIRREGHFGPVVAHAPYTMNPCAAREDIRELAFEMMSDDLARMEKLTSFGTPEEVNFYNFHPGSHVGQGAEEGIRLTADLLNKVLTRQQKTVVLLETMSGKGTEIGRSFEELAAILERVELREKVGVCLDTCHTWDAGYDLAGDLDGVLLHFDRVIGLEKLRAVHLNDSKNARGSHKDRHEKLGEGRIGAKALKQIVQHSALQNRPFILETPNEDAGYRKEIGMVKEWRT